MKGTYLGEFEELVLLTVGILGKDAYGVAIKDDLTERTGRNPSIGALHSALTRLEKKGFVRSEMEGATPDRRGRRKRYYRMTAAGESVLKAIYEQRNSMYHLIPKFGT
ncbi:MAG TPA: PadR family transcriptional regulator [Cytophagales bacterium]|nr:PadR family transcriptional regulator [Cytophagales bacterium]HAA22493.1 PadR family transcriptional regulator [Cytophagales bacterium]HAP62164.1 PadR family transcriptional regulator [Cytophagales bacterium]